MVANSDFSKFLTSKLSSLAQNKIKQTGSLTFGSLTQAKNLVSVFQKATNNVEDIDYELITQALKEGNLDGIDDNATKGIASIVNELLAIEEIGEIADVSGNGKISAAELEEFVKGIAGADGDGKTITMEDINKLIQEVGVDLDKVAETAIKDALAEMETDEAEEEKAKEAEKAQASSTPASSSGGTVGGSSGGSSVGGYSGTSKTKTTDGAGAGESPEQIQQKIDAKNKEISEVESDAEAQIKEQEAAKEKAMKDAGVSEKEYEEYKKKEEEVEQKITEKEESITKKDDEIADHKSNIESNNNYIASIEVQIKDNESRKASITGDDADSKKAKIDGQIKNLQNKKAELENKNKEEEAKVKSAETEKQKLEQEKTKLEQEKAELLRKTLGGSKDFAKGIADSSSVKALTENIMSYDTKIQEIKADKASKVSELKGDIQSLQVELKDAQAREEREKFIKENKAVNGLGLTGEELVEVAKQMLQKYGSSTGLCATGVSRTFAMAYGLDLHGNGCDWDTNMDKLVEQGAFEEVTGDYATSADLAHAPAGAVVCWEATTGVGNGGAKYGHVTIADGNGGEISDHYAQSIYKSIGGRSDLYRVFVPVC